MKVAGNCRWVPGEKSAEGREMMLIAERAVSGGGERSNKSVRPIKRHPSCGNSESLRGGAFQEKG